MEAINLCDSVKKRVQFYSCRLLAPLTIEKLTFFFFAFRLLHLEKKKKNTGSKENMHFSIAFRKVVKTREKRFSDL